MRKNTRNLNQCRNPPNLRRNPTWSRNPLNLKQVALSPSPKPPRELNPQTVEQRLPNLTPRLHRKLIHWLNSWLKWNPEQFLLNLRYFTIRKLRMQNNFISPKINHHWKKIIFSHPTNACRKLRLLQPMMMKLRLLKWKKMLKRMKKKRKNQRRSRNKKPRMPA